STSRKPPAWYYARLVAPVEVSPHASWPHLRNAIDRQFYGIHAWRHYAGPLTLTAIVLALELALCESWVEAKLISADSRSSLWPVQVLEVHGRIPLPIIMGLLGGYVWSLYEVVSRKASGDLTPHELNDVVMRLIVSAPIGYAFSMLAIDRFQGAFAFTVSAFPIRDV